MLQLTKDIILFCVKYGLMSEFRERGLHIKYESEIKEWFTYLDRQKFAKKLEKQMLEEVDRFMATRESVDSLMERVFDKPKWEIEFLDDVSTCKFIN